MNAFIPSLSIILYIGFLFLPASAQAQVEELERMQQEFDKFKQKAEEQFFSFADSIDQEFAKYIRDNWEKFEAFSLSGSPLGDDKPITQPKAPKINTPPTEINPPSQIIQTPKTPKREVPQEEEIPFQKQAPKEYESTNLPYYGLQLPIEHEAGFYFELKGSLLKSIPDIWEYLANSDYELLLDQVHFIQQKIQLNDFGYLQLIQMMSARLLPNLPNEQLLMTCFLLNKDGFIAKIGFDELERIVLLVPCIQDLYNITSFKIGPQKYYGFVADGAYQEKNPLTSYENNYEGSEKIMDFKFYQPVKLPKKVASRNIQFDYLLDTFNVEVQYDRSHVEFLEKVQPVSFQLTLSAPLSETALQSIKQQLNPLLEGKSELEQVNILLAFVQKGFEYSIDQDQFGYEKYFYPEQLFYFPQSDCEDRSALFCCLVQNLLGLEAIGLLFPEHVATAVKFRTPVNGDFIRLNEERYVICDPTYIGADAGMCMPKFKESSFQVILLK